MIPVKHWSYCVPIVYSRVGDTYYDHTTLVLWVVCLYLEFPNKGTLLVLLPNQKNNNAECIAECFLVKESPLNPSIICTTLLRVGQQGWFELPSRQCLPLMECNRHQVANYPKLIVNDDSSHHLHHFQRVGQLGGVRTTFQTIFAFDGR
jgi:hypothetical protein